MIKKKKEPLLDLNFWSFNFSILLISIIELIAWWGFVIIFHIVQGTDNLLKIPFYLPFLMLIPLFMKNLVIVLITRHAIDDWNK